MNEVKRPRKTLAYFYCIAAILLMLFNLFVMPKLSDQQVKDALNITNEDWEQIAVRV